MILEITLADDITKATAEYIENFLEFIGSMVKHIDTFEITTREKIIRKFLEKKQMEAYRYDGLTLTEALEEMDEELGDE